MCVFFFLKFTVYNHVSDPNGVIYHLFVLYLMYICDSTVRHYDYEAIISLALHTICFIVQSLVIIHFYVKIRKPTRQISKAIKFSAISVIIFVWIAH